MIKAGHFGEGFLELYPGVMVLKLHGTPYEIGFEHGAMLKNEIGQRLEDMEARTQKSPAALALERVRLLIKYQTGWPARSREELGGMAEGSGIGLSRLAWLNMVELPSVDARKESASEPSQPTSPGMVIPTWLLAVYHPEGGGKVMAVARPGQVGIMAGMDEHGCCVMGVDHKDDEDLGGVIFLESFLDGSCPDNGGLQKDRCYLRIMDGQREAELFFYVKPGLVCITHDRGKSWRAVDLDTESFHKSCLRCDPEAEPGG